MRDLRVLGFLLLITACAAPKAPPTDDPDVDDTKADSLRAPTMQPTIGSDGLAAFSFTTSNKYVAWPMHLDAGQQVDVWVGGADNAGGTLDTVAYLYGPKDAHGRRGAYLTRVDDWSDDSYASRFQWTAGTSGDFLIVATTYAKPDPGTVFVTTTLLSGRPALTPPSTPHAMPLDARPFADPELLAATSVDDILALLDRDVGDGDPLTVASDINALWGGRKWPLDVVDRVDQAVHAALPTATTFGQWPARAQSILLSTDRVFVPVTTSKKPNLDPVIATLVASAPGFTYTAAFPTAFGYSGKLFGFQVDVRTTDTTGNVFINPLYFDRAGNLLGDNGGGYDDSGD